MRRSLCLTLFLLAGTVFYGQEKMLNRIVYDSLAGNRILLGYCNLEGLHKPAFDSGFMKEYDSYQPDHDTYSQMYNLLDGIRVTIVMATWCSDSREQVPRFFKIFDALEHSFPDPEIICVDKEKKAGDVDISAMQIEKVPTFIVYFGDKELGRIIETPKETLEKDLLEILKR